MPTFTRTEKKYFVPTERYPELIPLLSPYMKPDKYGKQRINNVYFDTPDFRIIRASIEKPPYKEKLRLRCYGEADDNDPVFLELKKKYDGVVYKRRIAGTYSAIEQFIRNKRDIDSQIAREIRYFIEHYGAEPKLFIGYDRIAYCDRGGSDLRITFDNRITSRTEQPDLRRSDGDELFLGGYIMEIKVTGAMPFWLTDILSKNRLYPSSFSKYGEIYKKKLCSLVTVAEYKQTEKKYVRQYN